jgi:hypothetical protein
MPRVRVRETGLRHGNLVNPITLIRNWINELKRRRALKKHMEDSINTLLMIYVGMMILVAGMLVVVLKKK